MTHPRHTPASPPESPRTERARTERMTVRPLRDDRYVVETGGGTYVVDLDGGSCTCPDHSIRGSRCKHLRRVAMEVTAGAIPAPGERAAVCAVCGRRTFVPVHETGPQLCDRHDHAVGDVVRDRETDGLLVVVEATGRRADEVQTGEGRLVSDYESNSHYGPHEPVFRAVYTESLPARSGAARDAKRYAFPASRLRPIGRDGGGPREDAGADLRASAT